jgi:DNA-binding transcriptional LysR family regulator
MIGPNELRYFIETARVLNVSRAAERLGISQPALSRALKKTEHEVGLELFIRSKKGVSLTAAGQRLFEQSQLLIQGWEELSLSVRDQDSGVGGLIRLGCHSAVAEYTLPKFLPEFLKEHPRLNIQLTHGLSRHMTESVVSSRLDVAIAVNPTRHPDLVIKEICRDEVTLWKTKDCLNPNLLISEPSLLQTQDILKKLAKAGFQFDRSLESSSLEVICQLLKAGVGKAILPGRVVEAYSIEGISAEKGAPIFYDKICLVFKPEFSRTAIGKVFVRTLGSSFKGA